MWITLDNVHGPSASNITDAHTCHTHDIHNQPVLQDTTVSVEWYEYDPTIPGHLESVLGCKCYICSSLLKRHGQPAVTRRILMSPPRIFRALVMSLVISWRDGHIWGRVRRKPTVYPASEADLKEWDQLSWLIVRTGNGTVSQHFICMRTTLWKLTRTECEMTEQIIRLHKRPHVIIWTDCEKFTRKWWRISGHGNCSRM